MKSLLGSTPNTKPVKPGEFQNTGIDRWNFTKRGQALKNEGMLWVPAWKDLSKYISPTRGFFHDTRPNVGYEIDHKTVIDSHADQAVEVLASGMTSGLTSPSRPWFRLGFAEQELMEVTSVKIWLDMVQTQMLDIFQKSNIYGVLKTVYAEIAVFGTGCAFIEEDFNTVIRGRSYTAGEYYLGCGPDGRVNAFYRRFWMTVAQMIEKFGKDNVSPARLAQYQNSNVDVWCMVNHLIEVNDDRIPGIKDCRNMPFRSVYWEDGAMADSYLRIGGYMEFPVVAPRWDTTTTADSYGRGPGWKALGDGKMLQKLQKQALLGLDKVTNPPVQVDASVQGDANLMPGGVTRTSGMVPNAGVRQAYQVQIDLNAIEAKIQRTQQKIDRYFFADLFLMLLNQDNGRMTATEVAERQSEKLQILGPVLERLEGELLSPLIERTFEIMKRNNMLPPAPKEISGMELKVQYISILAQAQRMVGITAIDQWVGGVLQLAQGTQDPSVLDILNKDEINEEKADMLGVSPKFINDEETMAKIREGRAQQQQQAQQMAALQQGAMAAKDVGGTVNQMGNTPMGGNSALDATLAALKGAN